MYYKTKKVFIQNNKLYVDIADSNVFPIEYRILEYKRNSLNEALHDFFKSCLDGNFKLQSRCGRYKTILDEATQLLEYATKDIDFFYIGYKNEGIAKRYLAEHFCTELILGKKVNRSAIVTKMLQFHSSFVEEEQRLIEKHNQNKTIRVSNASNSYIFAGYNVFLKEGECILAKSENYKNGTGLLNNEKDDAIFFGPNTQWVWNVLRFDGYSTKTKAEIIQSFQSYMPHPMTIESYLEIFTSVEALIKKHAAHLTLAKLPYKDFPYENLGMKKIS